MGNKSEKYAIVCGGDTASNKWLKDNLSGFDFIIAADSGYDKCINCGVTPDIVIGDFDSSRTEIKNGVEVIKYPSEKDETDYTLCLEYCIKNGIKKVTAFGTMGGRPDHTLGAFLSSAEATIKGLNVTMHSKDYDAFIVTDSFKLKKTDGYVSVFSLESESVVTLKGFKYPLNCYPLKSMSSIGVSNRIIEQYGEISIKKGTLLVLIENK